MAKQFFLFIVLIRALAAIVITNSHYTGVYPTDLIANGGLLGDVLFFAVSGYCLANTKGGFGKWYLRRFVRVYIPAWVMTIIYMVLGAYVVTGWQDVVDFFVWPTHWHFVASIILLYVPLFFVSKHIEMNSRNYWRITGILMLVQLIIYMSVYDKSYYHIDKVREPMIEFLFFQAMLLGLHFRWKSANSECIKRLTYFRIGGGILLMVIYFTSKMVFVKMSELSEYQILNQIVLLALLYVLFDLFRQLEPKLKGAEQSKLWKGVEFIANRTLEIYLVQYVILEYCKIGPFPLNWLLLTTTILISAIILRWISQQIITRIKI